MYNGLTTADKGALMDAKARGGEWLAREFFSNEIWVWSEKPFKGQFPCAGWYSTNRANPSQGCIGMLNLKIAAVSCEPMNIDLALAQIAEMERDFSAAFPDEERESNTITNADYLRANIEAMARKTIVSCGYGAFRHHIQIHLLSEGMMLEEAVKGEVAFLNSPYTEGANR